MKILFLATGLSLALINLAHTQEGVVMPKPMKEQIREKAAECMKKISRGEKMACMKEIRQVMKDMRETGFKIPTSPITEGEENTEATN